MKLSCKKEEGLEHTINLYKKCRSGRKQADKQLNWIVEDFIDNKLEKFEKMRLENEIKL